jgi:hypothetical protein
VLCALPARIIVGTGSGKQGSAGASFWGVRWGFFLVGVCVVVVCVGGVCDKL